MLYDLIQTRRGKQTLIMTDTLPNVNQRKKTLLASQRRGVKGEKVLYTVVKSEGEKYKRKPVSEAWRAGDYAITPPRIK